MDLQIKNFSDLNINLDIHGLSVKAVNICKVYPCKDWCASEHSHSLFEFHIIPRGKGYVSIEGKGMHMERRQSLKEIAVASYTSERNLQHLFRKHMNCTVMDYINQTLTPPILINFLWNRLSKNLSPDFKQLLCFFLIKNPFTTKYSCIN